MKTLIKTLTLVILVFINLGSPVVAKTNGIIVVANTEEQITLNKQEVKSLFMGAYIGYNLTAVILPKHHIARIEFNTIVIGLTEDRIQSYWAQMRFSGRKKQPNQLQNEQAIIEYLLSHKGAIAYLPANAKVPDTLTVLYTAKLR